MPRLAKSDPKYRRHKQSDRGRVRVDGRDILLPGKYRSAERRAAYDRIVGEWRAHGRSLPPEPDRPITVAEVMAAYIKFAKTYYLQNGKTPVDWTHKRPAPPSPPESSLCRDIAKLSNDLRRR